MGGAVGDQHALDRRLDTERPEPEARRLAMAVEAGKSAGTAA
jgi:hypothetical protein